MKSKFIAFIFMLLLITTVSCSNETVVPLYDGIVEKLPDWFSNRRWLPIKETSTLQNPPILETSFYEIYEVSEDYEEYPPLGYFYGVFDGFKNMNGLQFSTTAENNKYIISIVLDTIMDGRKLFSEGEITYELTGNGQMKYTWDTMNYFTTEEETQTYHQLDTVMYKQE